MAINVRAVANGVVRIVNENKNVFYFKSAGNTLNEFGESTPNYLLPVVISVQIQDVSALTPEMLNHVGGLTMQGEIRTLYANQKINAVQSGTGFGGDVFLIDDEVWKVTALIEQWGLEWSRVLINKQLDTPGDIIKRIAGGYDNA